MRAKRFSKMRRKKETLDIDITSLLDILVILLVFLLKSYNASDLSVDIARGIKIPDSISEKLGNQAIIIQVSKNKKIWINNKAIGVINTNNNKINLLYNELQKYSLAEKKSNNNLGKDDKKKTRVNLIFDRDLPYKTISQVMHTASISGYSQFKFIVKGSYQ